MSGNNKVQLTEDEDNLEKLVHKALNAQKGIRQDNNWDEFRRLHYPLILKVARQAFQDKDFDLIDHDDILQEACAAYMKCINYHNPYSQKTKLTTSYVWKFQKSLKALAHNGNDCYTERNSTRASSYNNYAESELNLADMLTEADIPFKQEESNLAMDEEMFYNADLQPDSELDIESDLSDKAGDSPRESPRGSRYLICTESFLNVVDTEIHDVLKGISDTGTQSNLSAFKKTRNSFRSSRSFIKELQLKIKEGLADSKLQLYQAVCLNGSRNIVYVAGQNMSDAKKHIKQYGAILEIHPFKIKDK